MTSKARTSEQTDPGPTVFSEDQGLVIDDLRRRVEALEARLAVAPADEPEVDQEARDKEILSRFVTTHAEAVEQEAARKRQAERDAAAEKGGDRDK